MILRKSKRFVSFVLALNLVIQSFTFPLTAFQVWASEETIQSSEVVANPQTEPEIVVTEPEVTPTPTEEVEETASPVELTPTETIIEVLDENSEEASPEIDIVNVEDTETVIEENVEKIAEPENSETNNTDAPQAEVSTTPTITPEPSTETAKPDEKLAIQQFSSEEIENNILLQSLVEVPQSPEFMKPEIFTDKEDYTPRDLVLITGSNFEINTVYKLTVSSDDEPAVSEEIEIRSDSEGKIVLAYQLDGNYRPNYIVVVKLVETEIARVTFTDSRYNIELKLNNQNSITVTPGATVDLKVTLDTDWWWFNDDNWKSTKFTIGSNAPICDNTPDVSEAGNDHSSTYQTTAPMSVGNYDVVVEAFAEDNCRNSDNSNSKRFSRVLRVEHAKVTICHATGSASNPFESLPVDANAVDGAGNSDHNRDGHQNGEDIVPPGYWDVDGRNWTTENQLTWENDCVIPVVYGSIRVTKIENPDTGSEFEVSLTGTDYESTTSLENNESYTFDNLITGNYTLTETNNEAYNTTISCDGNETQGITKTVEIEGNDVECTITNTRKTGTIFGKKWQDQNDNQIMDSGEEKNGWTINLYTSDVNGNYNINSPYRNMVTGTILSGSYLFETLPLGDYVLCEVQQNNWYAVNPSDGCYRVSITPSNLNVNLNLQNDRFGSIKVIKDSRPNDSEDFDFVLGNIGGRVGQTTLDDDGNYWWSSSRPNNYTFGRLTRGAYSLTENSQYGWSVTSINCTGANSWSANGRVATINLGSEDVTCTFVNEKNGNITGWKWEDKDADARWDYNESTLRNWTIFIDDGDGVLENDEQQTTTNVLGRYDFDNLKPGQYNICEVVRDEDGWRNTSPNTTGCQSVTVNPGETTRNVNFGNAQRGSITVCKMIADQDGVVNNGSDVTAADFSVDWDKLPTTNFETGFEANARILSTSEQNDARCITYSDLPITTYKYSREVITSDNTGLWLAPRYNDQYESRVANLNSFYTYGSNSDSNGEIDLSLDAGVDRTLVILNQYGWGDIEGYKWNDTNTNGEWDCEMSDRKMSEEESTCEGRLSGVSIFLDQNENEEYDEQEQQTTTDESGYYRFAELTPGNYSVCETVPTGWSQTYPVSTKCHNIELVAGDTTRLDFGNTYLTPRLSISKTNNAISRRVAGDSVDYTIEVKVFDNEVRDLKVIDLPPEGFKYRVGSYKVYINGVARNIAEPIYQSPGTWFVGTVQAGDVVRLEYTADIALGIDPGIYNDLAYASGVGGYEEDLNVMAVVPETDPSMITTNMAGTQVSIDRDLRDVITMDVNKSETRIVSGAVLGMNTDLPKTGAETYLALLALALITLGSGSIYYAIKKTDE